MPEISLNDKIQNMLDELPEVPKGVEQRRNMLTRQDARWLANMMLVIAEHQGCHIGLSEDQAMALKGTPANDIRCMKTMVKERRRMMAVIGTGVLTVLVWLGSRVVDATDPGFWQALVKKIFGWN